MSAWRQTLARCNFAAWVPVARHSLGATLLHECLAPDTRSTQLYCMTAWRQTLSRHNFTAWVPGARHSLGATLLHECLAPDTHTEQLYCMNVWRQTLAKDNFTLVWHTAKIRYTSKMAKLHYQNGQIWPNSRVKSLHSPSPPSAGARHC